MRWLMLNCWGQGVMQHVLGHFSGSPLVYEVLKGSDCHYVSSMLLTILTMSHSADAQELVTDKALFCSSY